jgi:hypothetical protein
VSLYRTYIFFLNQQILLKLPPSQEEKEEQNRNIQGVGNSNTNTRQSCPHANSTGKNKGK